MFDEATPWPKAEVPKPLVSARPKEDRDRAPLAVVARHRQVLSLLTLLASGKGKTKADLDHTVHTGLLSSGLVAKEQGIAAEGCSRSSTLGTTAGVTGGHGLTEGIFAPDLCDTCSKFVGPPSTEREVVCAYKWDIPPHFGEKKDETPGLILE